jgi:hypothetical protein
MNWTDLVLKNWFVIVILIIMVSRFFKRRNNPANESSKPNAPSKGMPSFGGGGGSGWGDIMGKSIIPSKQPQAPAKAIPTLSKGSKQAVGEGPPKEQQKSTVVLSRKDSPEDDFWEHSPISDVRTFNMENRITSSKTADSQIRPSAKQLTQGMIWSEILGPPRSKRPFRK